MQLHERRHANGNNVEGFLVLFVLLCKLIKWMDCVAVVEPNGLPLRGDHYVRYCLVLGSGAAGSFIVKSRVWALVLLLDVTIDGGHAYLVVRPVQVGKMFTDWGVHFSTSIGAAQTVVILASAGFIWPCLHCDDGSFEIHVRDNLIVLNQCAVGEIKSVLSELCFKFLSFLMI